MKTGRLFHIVITVAIISFLSPMPGWLFAADSSTPVDIGIQKGDLVTANVTARTESGETIYTTEPLKASGTDMIKAKGYGEPDCSTPSDIIAGEDSPVPGLKDILPGMHVGEKRTVTIPAQNAYGTIDKNLIKQFDCIKTMKKTFTMKPGEYVLRFNKLPVTGAQVNANPYFPAKVKKVTEQEAMLENLPKDGFTKQSPFGKTVVRVKGDMIYIKLIPLIGADFEAEGKKGTITSSDGKKFTVDLNNPLAGKNIILTVEAGSSVSKAALESMKIAWSEDYKAGLSRGKEEHKPVLLVLYASWCQWSKKYFDETLVDPRIKAMAENFVWVKIDSDLNKEYKAMYQQEGFPLTVLLSPDGTVVKKLSGFNDAARLAGEIHCIAHGMTGRRETSKASLTLPQEQQGCTSGQ
jgi:FKBP-type peptidyl-prolyl cis-trans isomerase 2